MDETKILDAIEELKGQLKLNCSKLDTVQKDMTTMQKDMTTMQKDITGIQEKVRFTPEIYGMLTAAGQNDEVIDARVTKLESKVDSL